MDIAAEVIKALGPLDGIAMSTRLTPGFGNPGGANKADFAVVWAIPFSGPSPQI